MPSCVTFHSINHRIDQLNIQPKVGSIKRSNNLHSLSSRSFRINSLHSEDADPSSQPEASTSEQPETPLLFPLGPSPTAKPPPRLVKTRSGIPMFLAPIPEDRCPDCNGNGKLTCGGCKGKGRLNYRKAAMLPKGEKIQWCPHCRASGRWVCSACMGTGERREPMGFRIE
jgi:hypothetical protein